MFKFILISLISVQAFAITNAKEALAIAVKGCNEKVERAIQNAANDGECDLKLGKTCDQSLYDIKRLKKEGYSIYFDISSDLHVVWCQDRFPQSIDPNSTKISKPEYCPLPVKGKKNKCKDRK